LKFNGIVREARLPKTTFCAIAIAIDFTRWRTALLTHVVTRWGLRFCH
jgi:hypothetical protein